MKLNTLTGLLFLTYLTKYDIPRMYFFLSKYETVESLWTEEAGKNGLPMKDSALYDLLKEAEITVEKLKYFGVTPIPYFAEDYPENLKQLKASTPPVIYVRGAFKRVEMVAIVGTRDMTAYGMRLTDSISEIVIRTGRGIVSGLAAGVDSQAHWYAVMNAGYTIAVLATPLNTIYPKQNYRLANEILRSGGALVSELAFDINRGGQSFIQRNRIQVALSKVVIPIEMGINSGTMHTINFCKTQRKRLLILAPPSDIKDARVEGLLKLMEDQAKRPRDTVKVLHDLTEVKGELSEQNLRSDESGQLGLFSS